MLGMWLFIFNNVNVSVEPYLFVFGTFHYGLFGKSVTISAQAFTLRYGLDSNATTYT